MSESVIYRPENNRYMSVTNVRRVAPDNATPITSCEKFFPGVFGGRVHSIMYKGQTFRIDTSIPSIGPGVEYVVFFSYNSKGTLELVATGVTERVDGLLEIEPEAV